MCDYVIGMEFLGSSPMQLFSAEHRRLLKQRERRQAKGLMSRTMPMHVRYKSLYISLPSSANQHREMTKFSLVWGTRTAAANLSYFHF